MPPTFLILLGLIIYIGLASVTLVVFAPMLLIDSKKLLAKKVILTVLISFPCLLVMGLLCVIIFLIPALVFFWLANGGYIPKTPIIILGIIGALVFVSSVATTSLYLWFFMSKIIFKRLDNKPVSEFLDNDKVFKFLREYFIKLKLYNPGY
ncbi:hypothetical protein G3O08_06830 [Cryomorpha ignava]|uniref:Uncharacterized protein n=1 Tax=Cryomorpha ignava TaxID=101383 RepID=A0A7K3WQP6_9FLAO|nr:hypothetical protein [Cryomorpha ignava]NEN23212.1 hypothetical protein [Cryomorpha ignava]